MHKKTFLPGVWGKGIIAAGLAAALAGGLWTAACIAAAPQPVRPLRIALRFDFLHPGPRVPQMFMGFSIEWGLINHLTERKHGRLQKMVGAVKALERLSGPMLLRIGGNSQDEAAYNLPTLRHMQKFVHINISRDCLVRLHRLAVATGCKYVIGLNLGVNQPALAVKLVKEAGKIIGWHSIAAFEIGNEPDFFGRFGGIWKHNNYKLYLRRWTRYYQAIKPLLKAPNEIEGPAFGGGWAAQIPSFIRQEHARLAIVSLHRYALGAPIKSPSNPKFASIANLLKASAAADYAREIRPVIRAAQPYHLPVRFGEMNSAWGGGKLGVSNTLASALWGASTLLAVGRAGGAGVNIHMSQGVDQFPGYYGPLVYTPGGKLHRMPIYYGMLVAADVMQAGSRPIALSYHTRANLNCYAFLGSDHMLRLAVINRGGSARAILSTNLAAVVPGIRLVRGYQLAALHITSTRHMVLEGFRLSGKKFGRMMHTHLLMIYHKSGKVGLLAAAPHAISIYTFRLP